MTRNNSTRTHSFRRRLFPVLLGLLAQGTALANPQGAQVVNGQASFATQGGTLSITNTPGAIIHWQGFSIDAGEITRFIQQSSSSAVLNRVVGQDPSQILGSLQSNGRVFLINPNGILFGPGARVDVNGLVASTLDISNGDFLAGRLNFRAGDKAGAVVNQGTIETPSGGRVYLIAPSVENSGLITSPQGRVILAAGHQVSLVDSSSPDVDVIVSAPADRALNLGDIVAQGGSIGIHAALINQRGMVNADSMAVGENGKIILKASGDTLLEAGSRTTARGAGTGGEIQILGERVGLTGDAKVDASGHSGGGTVLVGGDYRGGNAAVRNAEQIYLGQDTEIRVDALETGNGGKAIAWSDGLSRVYGAISARGGERSGNGGFVETSGKVLDMQGRVDTRAPHGTMGTLLLDPTNIYIAANQGNATSAGMSGTDSSANSGSATFLAAGAVQDSLLTTGTLEAALATSSVIVTTANASGSAPGFINVVDPVTWKSPSSLTLDAVGGVFGPGTISGASLIVTSGSGVNLHTQVASLAASDTGNDTNIVFANTGALTLQNITQSGIVGAISITNTGLITVAPGATVSTAAGNITLTSAAGLTVSGTVTSTSGVVTLAGPIVAAVPSLAQCVANPAMAGCSAVLPAVQLISASNTPVAQALNNTVNLINTSTPAVKNDEKKEEKKDEKKEVAVADKPGVKNDDAAKKMYCN